MDGPANEVAQAYLHGAKSSAAVANRQYGFVVRDVILRSGNGNASTSFAPGDDLVVEVQYSAAELVRNPYVIVLVRGLAGTCFVANSLLDGHRPSSLSGNGTIQCRFKALPLLPQSYTIVLVVKTESRDPIIDYAEVASFNVEADLRLHGFSDQQCGLASTCFPVMIPYEWTLPDGSRHAMSLSSVPVRGATA